MLTRYHIQGKKSLRKDFDDLPTPLFYKKQSCSLDKKMYEIFMHWIVLKVMKIF